MKTSIAVRACLFGGALTAPGIQAQTFELSSDVVEPIDIRMAAYDTDYADYLTLDGTQMDYRYGGDAFTSSTLSGGFLSMTASAEPTSLSATFSADGLGSAYADLEISSNVRMQIVPTEDLQVLVEWSDSAFGTSPFSGASIVRFDSASGVTTTPFDTRDQTLAAGSQVVTLDAGLRYTLVTSWYRAGPVDAGYEAEGSYSISIVPAPASAALLGFAGLAATRRRR